MWFVRRRTMRRIRLGLYALAQFDALHKASGWGRTRRRQWWREFVGHPRTRQGAIASLLIALGESRERVAKFYRQEGIGG